MFKLFTTHPNSVGESYLTHMKTAFKYALSLASLSVVCLIHGIFPFLFTTTTSSKIKKMSGEMNKSRWSR